MSRWAWEIRDLAGVTRSIITPRSATITRNLNKASTVTLIVEPVEHGELSVTARIIRGFRSPSTGGARVLRAAGKVFQVTGAVSESQLEQLTLQAYDSMGWLASRFMIERLEYTSTSPRDIVNGIVSAQAVRGYIGMEVAAGTGGPLRDRTYEYGKNAAEAIQQLAEVDDGFYYRIDPLDEPDHFCTFNLIYPAVGSSSGASFEYGAGTASNIAGVSVDIVPPVNSVIALGAGEGDGQLRHRIKDTASVVGYGLYDQLASYADVVEDATLYQHALDGLRPFEPRTYRITPVLQSGAAYVPLPWEDFDVGDTVMLNLRGISDALIASDTCLVTSFTVTVDDSGVESLSSIDLQTVYA
jgi:hypothetical protein